MLCLAIIAIVQFRIEIIKDLKEVTIERNANGLANQYIHNIWNKNENTVKDIEKKSLSDLYSDANFISFASDTINLIQDLPVLKINIYDIKKRKLISNNRYEINNQDDKTSIVSKINAFISSTQNSDDPFAGVLQGSQFSSIIYSDYKNGAQSSVLIQVLIPIINQNKVEAILEFYYDITKEWQDVYNIQIIAIIGAILTFCLFFVILIVVSRKLEKMIEKQHEVNIELEEAKERAEVESSEKSKFLANISHELRTPLNAIIGFSEIIKTESLGPVGNQQYKDYANDINNSGSHLLSLINDILDYSKAAAEKLKVDSIELDVTKILSISMRLVKPRAEEAKVNLVEDISKEALILVADPKRLKQAVLNLLSNSVKFTPENGSVTISAWIDHAENILNIQVKDTGIGIADNDISKAMSTFGQVDSKLSRKYEGTGLGLPLTKKLVELMKGKFTIQSELGFGTTITLSFPYAAPVVKAGSEVVTS
jgi:two-component system cell cycle sensor histidine kinase PleC